MSRLPPSRFPIHFLQESCRSSTYQTLSARILDFRQTCQILADQTFLAESDVSCKILAGKDISCKILGRILHDIVGNLKDNLQENVWNVLSHAWIKFQIIHFWFSFSRDCSTLVNISQLSCFCILQSDFR